MTMPPNREADFWLRAKGMMVGAGMVGERERWAREQPGLTPRDREMLLRSVPAATTGSDSWAGDLVHTGTMVGPWSDFLRTDSWYERVRPSMVPSPSRRPLIHTIAGAPATSVDEAAAKPVVQMEIGNVILVPQKVSTIITMTREVARDASGDAQAFLAREARGGATSALDGAVTTQITSSTDAEVIASSGSDIDNVVLDLRSMLAAIDYGRVGRASLNWVLAQDVAKKACALWDSGGWMFENLSPTGGEMLNLPAMVSKDLPAGTVLLLDASGFAASTTTISVRASTVADLELLSSPTGDSSTPQAASLVSMFQTDSVALLAEATFAFAPLRERCVVMLEGAAWGGEATL